MRTLFWFVFWNKWYFLISYCNSTGQHPFWRVQNFGLEFSEFLSFESYNGFKIGVISSIKNVLKVNKNLSLIDKEASLLPAVLVRFFSKSSKIFSLIEHHHEIVFTRWNISFDWVVYIGKGPYRMFSKYIFLNILITFLHGQLSKLYEYLNGRTNLAKRLLRSYTLIKKNLFLSYSHKKI